MSLTLQDIWDRTRSDVRDTAKTFISEADVTRWANTAQEDLAARLQLLQGETSSTTTTYQVALPSGFIGQISFRMGEDDVEFVDDDVWSSWSDSGDDPGHTLGRIYNANVELYPTPASGTAYTFRYYKKPTDLAVAGDSSTLPSELHIKLVYYATARAKWKEKEYEAGDRFMSLYEKGLPGVSTGLDRRFPGPLSITRDPGPFDTSESAHI